MPWIRNPRKNDSSVKKVAASISRFGFGSPILARRENGEIIAGHTRVKAAKKLGLTHVPVRYLDLSEDEAHKLAVADNKTAEEASWDQAALAEIMGEWDDAGEEFDGLGFDDEELSKLLGENYESEIQEVDVTKARAEFFLSVHGPLPEQRAVLEALRKHLEGLQVNVTITTTEM